MCLKFGSSSPAMIELGFKTNVVRYARLVLLVEILLPGSNRKWNSNSHLIALVRERLLVGLLYEVGAADIDKYLLPALHVLRLYDIAGRGLNCNASLGVDLVQDRVEPLLQRVLHLLVESAGHLLHELVQLLRAQGLEHLLHLLLAQAPRDGRKPARAAAAGAALRHGRRELLAQHVLERRVARVFRIHGPGHRPGGRRPAGRSSL